ncbi:oxygen-independent coproporphyrinogen III oxidase [Algoriphagus kandeliae]|uniref:Coproporphyrinogen-III oxidase n=1 Tax=Algoriphagus kandeliae TaxID=2562278 RepID=A0A4Y9QXB0_9BACT|nr:oxygen-independent coproporphyrinogen III oxidase [Algoriphagus kandeliae]TFV97084.1 oxygen-independent coproporphyrinogen III oxidase [Algoriphagus kandeliae]
MITPALIQKYNTPAPRYTSYPTVPLWENNVNSKDWNELVSSAFSLYGKEEGITLYIHLPFCESLCTYCGCNKRITKNHAVEDPYIDAVLHEWNNYLKLFGEKSKLAGIHLGGGTPTFFAPESLNMLLSNILDSSIVLENAEFSFEGHPNNTTQAHLQVLADLGFDRVSYGIQDFDEKVQNAIHRIQPFEKVKQATEQARQLGYTSINFDLIYGLPFQTKRTLADTFEKVVKLAPDRIAFYSYAHVPSSFPAQKSYEAHLPSELEKRELYEFGKQKLKEVGYVEIGMDHFSKQEDPLYLALQKGTLHRNFMGFTTSPSKILLGLGASSISDIYLAYAQNEKSIDSYQSTIAKGDWAISKGHQMTEQDLKIRDFILDLICNHSAVISREIWEVLGENQLDRLSEMQEEKLVDLKGDQIRVTEDGIMFIRQICKLFDVRLQDQKKDLVFSKAI